MHFLVIILYIMDNMHWNRYQTDQIRKKVPQKVLHLILTMPRLKQLFRCESIVEFMDYHAWKRSGYGVLWIPTHGYGFREIEKKWPCSKDEARNVRFLLEVGSVNPFGEIRSIYSMWPIFVIENNLPPLMLIKREHIMLTMIVPCICLH